ncbi:MAG: thioesterase family protein [Bacillota bacterium]
MSTAERWHEARVAVRYAETDQMGVVYYANYLVWFEVGRTELFRALGLTYRRLEELGLLAPAIEAHVWYHHSARYDDQLVVRTALVEAGVVRYRFRYEVVRSADGALLATGETAHTFIDSRGKPVALRRSHPELWEKLQGLVGANEQS